MKIPEEYHKKMISLLEKEYNLYLELKDILILERKYLSDFKYDSLSDINLQKEGILLNIFEIKNRRNNFIKELCNNFNLDYDNFNLSFLASISEPKNKKIYENFKEKFKEIGFKIKNFNEINKFVIETSLSFIEKSLNIVNQNLYPSTYSNYGKIVKKSYTPSTTSLYTGKI